MATILAERVRTKVENYTFEKIPWTITVSIGISEIIENDKEDVIIDRADKNLYIAKKSGRNRTV